jgi:hypothetical protein
LSAAITSEALSMAYAVGAVTAPYTRDNDAQLVMMPVSLETQLMPGTPALALPALVQPRRETSRCERTSHQDATGCPAYDPKSLLKVLV